jgi:mono/diheme cytochrome c family protein
MDLHRDFARIEWGRLENGKGVLIMRMRWMGLIVCLFALAMVPLGAAQGAAADSANLYKTKCAVCHGADGAGKSSIKNTELLTTAVQKQTDAQLQAAVANGKGKMPAFKDKLSKEQIASLVAHIRSLAGAPKAASAAESKAKPADAQKPAKAPEKAAAATASEMPAAPKMEAMHKEHMEHMAAMKAQLQKLHAALDQMKANVDKITDADEKARWQANVDMWQTMVDHLDQMMKQMEAMPGPGMGMGGGHHGRCDMGPGQPDTPPSPPPAKPE